MKNYTVKDIMKKYGVSHRTVCMWINSGELDATLIYDEKRNTHKYVITKESLERFEVRRPCRRWKFSRLSQDIDIIARNNLETLYGVRDYIDEEIMKYKNILSIINDEETF